MKILIINHNAGSSYYGPNYRSYYFAVEFINLGHEVTIVASARSNKLKNLPDQPLFVNKEIVDGVTFLWLFNIPVSSGITRFINYLIFGCQLFLLPFICKDDFDLVICSSPPPLWAIQSFLFALIKKAILVNEFRDIWPDVLTDLSVKHFFNPFYIFLKSGELLSYRFCDSAVFVNKQATKIVIPRGLSVSKFIHVPNGVSMSSLNPLYSRQSKLYLASGKVHIVYCGSLSYVYGIHSLFDAIALIHGDIDYVLHLIGEGPLEHLVDDPKYIHLSIVKHKWLPRNELNSVLESMDFAYAGHLCAPSIAFGSDTTKVYDYMNAGLPIVFANSNATSDSVVTTASCGINVSLPDPSHLANAILKLSTMSHLQRRHLGTNGYNYLKAHHSYLVLANGMLNSILEHHPELSCK